MIELNPKEATEVFLAAKNLNASLKNFLKREIPKGDPREKLVKSFRKHVTGNSTERLEKFVEQITDKDPATVLGLAGYAHETVVTDVSQQIIDDYAEDFNASYETNDTEAIIKDNAKFEAILKTVSEKFKQTISENNLPDNQFMMLVMIHSLFEEKLIEKVLPYFT